MDDLDQIPLGNDIVRERGNSGAWFLVCGKSGCGLKNLPNPRETSDQMYFSPFHASKIDCQTHTEFGIEPSRA